MVTSSASALASMVATAERKRTCPLSAENSTSNLWLQCLQSCWRYFEPLAVFARPLTMAIFKTSLASIERSPGNVFSLAIKKLQTRLAPLRQQDVHDVRNSLLETERRVRSPQFSTNPTRSH